MPVQTAIQLRRGTAASWTSTNPTLAAGEIGFETDTGKFKIGTGSVAWASLGYFAQDPVTTKGDLYTFSTTDARLAVGSNGDTLVADSAATTGLRWQGNFAAGKNVILNGDFRINQRSFTSSTVNGYGQDRWSLQGTGGTRTYSAESFTAGTAPVAGYEGINFARLVTSGQSASGDYTILSQRVEDARTFANQTVTLSFWAKASTGTPAIAATFFRNYGSGGSPSASEYAVSAGQKATISTSWARYSFTFSISSVSGKTFGTSANSSFLDLYLWTSAGTSFATQSASLGVQNTTIDIWGVQVEAGSVATAFQTATGTLQGELAACQRYYYRHVDGNSQAVGVGANYSAGEIDIFIQFPVTMRGTPSLVISNGTDYYRAYWAVSTDTFDAFVINQAHNRGTFIYSTTGTAVSSGMPSYVQTNNASASIAFNAEL